MRIIFFLLIALGLSSHAYGWSTPLDGSTKVRGFDNQSFPSLLDALDFAAERGLKRAHLEVTFSGQGICGRSTQGLFLGRVYDSDKVYINHQLVGQTGSPDVDTLRLSQKQRLYRIPDDMIQCGDNTMSLELARSIGRRIGPLDSAIVGDFHELEGRKYRLEALSLVQRDLGILLIALASILFIIFRRAPDARKYMEASAMLLSFGAYGITLSGWPYELIPWPELVYKLNAALVVTALATFLRFRLAISSFKVRLGPAFPMLLFTAAVSSALVFSIPSQSALFSTYLILLSCGIAGALAVHFADVKAWKTLEWALSTVIVAAMTSDILRIWTVHSLPNFSVYVNGVAGFVLTFHYSGRLVPVFQAAMRAKDMEAEVKAQAAVVNGIQMIAHDLRNPFSLMKIFLQNTRDMKTHEEMKSFVDVAVPEIDRSLSSVNGFLEDLMQIKGEPVLYRECVSMLELVHQSVGEAFSHRAIPGIEFSFNIPPELHADADAARLKRVFVNILNNAAQAMHDRGKISVCAHTQGNMCTVEIENTNSFIEPDKLPNIFDSFYTSGKKGGTGLGLAIAKKWVEAHGGAIGCESGRCSTAPEGYVRFRFTVPVVRRLQGPSSITRGTKPG